MAGPLENVALAKKSNRRLGERHASDGRVSRASQPDPRQRRGLTGAAKWSWRKGLSHPLDAFTQSSWLVTNRKRVFGMTPTMVGGTTR